MNGRDHPDTFADGAKTCVYILINRGLFAHDECSRMSLGIKSQRQV